MSKKSEHPLPDRLSDVVLGQARLFDGFARALEQKKLAHAFLLLGPRGVGRGRLATALAQSLLCAFGPPACGQCPPCKQARKLTHPDLHLLFPATKEEERDGERRARILEEYAGDRYRPLGVSPTATIGIEQVRQLKESLSLARVVGPRRVAIVFDAGKLTEQAGQSALKLVEEPPPDTLLFLTAEETAGLLPTLVSRCQRLRLRPLPRAEVAMLLTRDLEVDAAEANLLASLSGGVLGRALELRQEGLLELRDQVLPMFANASADPRAIESAISRLGSQFDAGTGQRAIELLLLWHRDLLAAARGLPASEFVHVDRASEIERMAAELRLPEVRRRIELLEELSEALKARVNPELALHAALSRWGSGARAGELWP